MIMKNIAIVGATGFVGSCFLDLMAEKNISVDRLHLFASEKNKGRSISWGGKTWPVQALQDGCFKSSQIAFFSAGKDVSSKWAKQAEAEGCTVIDNSSAFRMEKDIPLIVPEINAHLLSSSHKLIANPNCSTIQLCLALHPLHQTFGIESVQAATYQSMSGAGSRPFNQLKEESLSVLQKEQTKGWPYADQNPLAFNCTPQIGSIQENGLCEEEIKMRGETRKILNLPQLKITVLTVRVPAFVSHGEVVWVQLKKKPSHKKEFIQALKSQKGLNVMEEPDQYPDNRSSTGQDCVSVGRIHHPPEDISLWLMWICADNLRKGAALNGLQIAQHLWSLPDR